ncbi:MAG: gamma-glutamyl-gamma-aminobutyrate hydrolase family protein [Calditrichaeota bacterium]|nr:gamma-glutamyl-gamma-aminobutyrate hydrolase family protein [Calditrichota bacterium]
MTDRVREGKAEGRVHQYQERKVAPIVGLTCDYSPVDDDRGFSRGHDLYFVNCDYVRPLSDAGVAPVVLPSVADPLLVASYVSRMDGLLLTGGDDIDPEAYGETQLDPRWKTDRQRTVFERVLIAEARRAGLPIFGICRGCESINVALGGSLYQDIPTMIPGAVQHQAAGNPLGARHRVRIAADSQLAQILGCVETEVNSFHHQAIRRVADAVRVVASAPDGVVEAIEVPEDFFTIAVQWHPERMSDDERQRALFAAFLDAVRRRAHARR